MKIKRIKIHNLYSYYDAEFELGDYNVIVGPNGAGKTNLIRILKIIKNFEHDLDGNIKLIPKYFIDSYNQRLEYDKSSYIILKLEFTKEESRMLLQALVINNVNEIIQQLQDIEVCFYFESINYEVGKRTIQTTPIHRRIPANIIIRFGNGWSFIFKNGGSVMTYTRSLFEEDDIKSIYNFSESRINYSDIKNEWGKQLNSDKDPNIERIIDTYCSKLFLFKDIYPNDTPIRTRTGASTFNSVNILIEEAEPLFNVNTKFEKLYNEIKELRLSKEQQTKNREPIKPQYLYFPYNISIPLGILDQQVIELIQSIDPNYASNERYDYSTDIRYLLAILLCSKLALVNNNKLNEEELTKEIFYMKNSREYRNKYEILQCKFKQLSDMKVDVFMTYTCSKQIIIKDDNKEFSLEDSASGYFEILYIFSNILEKKDSIIILDEPALNLHSTKIKQLAKELKELVNESGNQVILITHSPYFVTHELLNDDSTNLLYIRKDEQDSKVYYKLKNHKLELKPHSV